MVSLGAPVDGGNPFVEMTGLRAADGLQALRAGGTRLRHDVQSLAAPMRRHLAAARARIVAGAHAREEHVVRRDAERQAQGAVAIVGIEPVVARAEVEAGSHEDGFVSGPADLKEDQALILELNLFVVDPPREQHQAVGAEEIVAGKTGVVCGPVGSRTPAVADRRSFHACGVLVAVRSAGPANGLATWTCRSPSGQTRHYSIAASFRVPVGRLRNVSASTV